MRSISGQLVRSAFRQLKSALKATRIGRNLLSDLNNNDEFTSLFAHERMLADRVRMDAYHAAINRHVADGDVVIDLGTGTGILALMAAKRRPKIVYALDHSEFIHVARTIAAHNGVRNIEFVQCNSRDFTPPQRADLIIHEQMGDELFSENMLENLLDLKKNALAPGGRILPARFELFVEPATLKPGRELPHVWENSVHGIDFSPLRDAEDLARYKPAHYDRYLMEPGAVDHWLCEPEPLLAFDLDTMDHPDELDSSCRATRRVVRSGVMDGFAVYFRVRFDADIGFDTSPLGPLTHWRSRLFRTPRRHCEEDESISYALAMTNPADVGTWSITLDSEASEDRLDRPVGSACASSTRGGAWPSAAGI